MKCFLGQIVAGTNWQQRITATPSSSHFQLIWIDYYREISSQLSFHFFTCISVHYSPLILYILFNPILGLPFGLFPIYFYWSIVLLYIYIYSSCTWQSMRVFFLNTCCEILLKITSKYLRWNLLVCKKKKTDGKVAFTEKEFIRNESLF